MPQNLTVSWSIIVPEVLEIEVGKIGLTARSDFRLAPIATPLKIVRREDRALIGEGVFEQFHIGNARDLLETYGDQLPPEERATLESSAEGTGTVLRYRVDAVYDTPQHSAVR